MWTIVKYILLLLPSNLKYYVVLSIDIFTIDPGIFLKTTVRIGHTFIADFF